MIAQPSSPMTGDRGRLVLCHILLVAIPIHIPFEFLICSHIYGLAIEASPVVSRRNGWTNKPNSSNREADIAIEPFVHALKTPKRPV